MAMYALAVLLIMAVAVSIYKTLSADRPVDIKKETVSARKEEKTIHNKIRRTYNNDGGVAYEEVDQFITKKLSAVKKETQITAMPRDYILGATLNVDRNYNDIRSYNIVFGRRVFSDLYIIGKTSTNLKLNRTEAGFIWNF